MTTRTTTARGRAVAASNAEIDSSQGRAIAARNAEVAKPRSALEAMAMSLNVSPSGLKSTLVNTVFKGCRNEAEFIALVIVSNTYGLNPLLKEIYAFPAKGGGVVPMVSVDGWIKLMHLHPAYDGIEFEDIMDNDGRLYAIEATIYRTDKTRPTKIIEYLEECKRNTDPWKQSPSRMLRHRALMQCARVAFGFSGLGVGDPDSTVIEASAITSDGQAILPSREDLTGSDEGDFVGETGQNGENEQADPQTGEIIDQQTAQDNRGMTEVSEEEARALDAGFSEGARQVTHDIDGPLEGEGDDHGDDSDDADHHDDEPGEEPAWLGAVQSVRQQIGAAKNLKGLDAVENDWLNRVRGGIPDDDVIRGVEKDIASRKRALKAEAAKQ